MKTSWKEGFAKLTTKVAQPMSQGLFNGATNVNAAKLNKIQRETPNIQLRANDHNRPVIEALVSLSWRDSIISIPRAIIPNVGREGYTLFSLDESANPKKPLPTTKPAVIAFMDHIHLEDTKCDYQRSRWAVLKMYKSARSGTPVSEIYLIPDRVLEDSPRNIQRANLAPPVVYQSHPAFEVDPMDWYYEEVLRRMGLFLELGRPIPSNNLTKFYQYMSMKVGNFIQMYSFAPDTFEKVKDETLANEESVDPVLSVRQHISPEVREEPADPILTIRQQIESSGTKSKGKPIVVRNFQDIPKLPPRFVISKR